MYNSDYFNSGEVEYAIYQSDKYDTSYRSDYINIDSEYTNDDPSYNRHNESRDI